MAISSGNAWGTNSRTEAPDVEGLFQSARDEGILSPEGMDALHVVDLGAAIQAGLGIPAVDVPASEVVLLTVMPDDSGSIRMAGNAQAVRDGHNLVVDALAKSKQKDAVLAHNRYLNGRVLYPYCPIDRAVKMDSKNYDPNEGTPLYDQTVVLLGTVIAKAQEFAMNGVPVRTITLIITDGADAGSQWAQPRDVRAVVGDMRRAESHIVAAMGIDDGRTDFRAVFRSMGIEDRWILTPGSSAGEIRRAFSVFSQSAARLSQGGGTFARAAAGGFGG
jgi:hypothetical protein